MMNANLIPASVLKRKAVVYVRQSTQSQVMTNLESQRRQYDLVDVARQRGFTDVEVIDDDLGRSASGTVARPGFDRLVAWLSAGKVGAVLCFDASRLARNGRDWHHLLELCGLVEARVIDLDMHFPDKGYLNEAIEVIKATGAIIVADEVQAGLGRLGTDFWAWQHAGITPDILTSGKPMGNGHPIGAAIVRGDILRQFQKVDRYFNTYAGNPVSCAAGLAVLNILERDQLPNRARRGGKRLNDMLRSLGSKHAAVGEVRGSGYLVGVEIVDPIDRAKPDGDTAKWILNELCRLGILVGRTGPNRRSPNIIKIRPPMVFDESHIDLFVSAVDETLTQSEVVRCAKHEGQ